MFSTLSENGTISRSKFIEHDMYFRFLYNVCLIQTKPQREIYINFHTSSFSCPLCLPHFNKTSFFATYFRKIFKYQISLKYCQWQPKRGRTDGHTDEISSRFSQFWARSDKIWPWTWYTWLKCKQDHLTNLYTAYAYFQVGRNFCWYHYNNTSQSGNLRWLLPTAM
jgi:hypothetical protein